MEVKDRRAVVYFSYAAQDEDELNISPGQVHIAYTVAEELSLIVTYTLSLFLQVVHVLGKGEEGWWKGELEGKEGVFPDNFVELIPLYEPSTLTYLIWEVLWMWRDEPHPHFRIHL